MSKIKVTVCFDRFLVWNEEDAVKLKSDWRVIGSKIGCHEERQFQSVVLGLPLELTKYEAVLLVEESAVDLCEVSLSQLSSEDRDGYERINQVSFEKHKEELMEEKKRMIMMNRDSVLEKGRGRRGLGSSVSDEEIIEEKLRESRECITMDKYLPPFHKECWIGDRVKMITSEMRKNFTPLEECKYKVFKELWYKGFYITPGHKFSCDFLAYEGDPEQYHARFMVLCSLESNIPRIEIAMKGRLSVQVNKELLIGHFSSEAENVDFSLVSWKGK